MNLLENDYDSDEMDINSYNEFSLDIIAEFEEDKKIQIIDYYKNLLYKEPEFIGIKNICSGMILSIIENINNMNNINYAINKTDYQLNTVQCYIFNDMYLELNSILNFKKQLTQNINIYNLVTKKIFEKIYV